MDLSCSAGKSLAPGSETVIVVARDLPSSQDKQKADSPGDSDNQEQPFSAINSTNQQTTNGGGTRHCLICGQISHGFHFGILACRACAAFFRRTVVEKKSYKCRQNCQCPIRKEMRNMCRACRFQNCEMLGMNKADVQMNRDPIGRRKENSASTTPTTTVECCAKPKQCCSSKPHENPTSQTCTSTLPSLEPHLHSFMHCPNEDALAGGVAQLTPQQQQLLLGQAQQEQLLSESIATSLHSNQHDLHKENWPTLGHLSEKGCFNGFNVTTASLLAMPQAIKYTPAVTTATSTSAIAFIPYSVQRGPSMLQRMLEGFINFQSSQKSLYTVMYPGEIFARETYRMVRHSEYVKMERGCLSLMYSMLNDWFQPFDSIIHDSKVAVLREFSVRFTLLDQCFRTMQTFAAEDNRFVIHYGQYIDANNMEYFFSENKDPKMLARMAINIMIPCQRAVAKMRQMVIRDVEIAALAVGHLNVEDTDKVRNQIYTEIHNNMILTYGVSETGARLGSLLGLLHDFDVIQKEISESITIGKIFNPHHYEVWDDI